MELVSIAVNFLTYILEVLGSFFGLDIGHRGVIRGLPQSLQANVRMISRLGQDRFLTDSFKIIIHPSI
jgi:hypothetical protein